MSEHNQNEHGEAEHGSGHEDHSHDWFRHTAGEVAQEDHGSFNATMVFAVIFVTDRKSVV